MTVTFEMLADGDGLLDQVVKIFGDLGGKSYCCLGAVLVSTEYGLEEEEEEKRKEEETNRWFSRS